MNSPEDLRAKFPPGVCYVPEKLHRNVVDYKRNPVSASIGLTVTDGIPKLECDFLNPDLTCKVLKKISPAKSSCIFSSLLRKRDEKPELSSRPLILTHTTPEVKLTFNFDEGQVVINGQKVDQPLTNTEACILRQLLEHVGVPQTREALFHAINPGVIFLGATGGSDYKMINVYVSRLRGKIDPQKELIKLARSGYVIPPPPTDY